jgi:RNA polymerase primary sigma factor
MIDALRDGEKVELEDDVQKISPSGEEEEPDSESLAAVESEDEEKDTGDDYEDFSMDAIKLYLKDIQKTSLLTAEEERALARRIDEGDMAARDRMIESNLRLVRQNCQTLYEPRPAVSRSYRRREPRFDKGC